MIPQALAIYQSHSALHVSLVTWVYFIIADIVWILYGVRNRLRPFIICHIIYLIVESSVVIGILLYS